MSSTRSLPHLALPMHTMAPSALTRQAPITIAIDPVNLMVTECITVTSAMRKHARWAHSSVAAILGGGSKFTASIDTAGRRPGQNEEQREDEGSLGGRWGLRGKKGKSLQDNPLMSAFTKLRSDLKGCRDIKDFDTPSLLHPFLQVIRSSSTSASITSLALIAITKFLSYNVISRDSPRLPEAMQLLSLAITHCRFEASSTAADEVVYIRILKLMEGMISGPGGELLSDESVCHIMETGIGLCCESRFTQILQRSAEITMVSMCQVVFERLKNLEIEAGDEPGALEEETKDDMDNVQMEVSVNGNIEKDASEAVSRDSSSSNPEADNAAESNLESKDESEEKGDERISEEPNNVSAVDLGQESVSDEPPPIKPYSLPSIKELFRSLVELLDPHDTNYTDAMRVMALRIVDVALEVAGPSIANHPSLATLAQDTLCRHLFQLVRSENMAILNESLRVAGTLLSTCRSVLKLQQELFLSYVVACLFPKVDIPAEPGIDPRLYEGIPRSPSLVKPAPSSSSGSASGRSTPVPVKDRQRLGLEGGARKPDAREAMIESIGALVRLPTFMTELFVNYDCDIDRTDLCSDMVGLMSRNAFPDSAIWSTTNVPPLCLDALLGYVQSIFDRLEDEPETQGVPELESLRRQRALKGVIIRGSSKFNESPKAGVAYLASQGVIENVEDPVELGKFLKGTSRLDKKVLGDFISKSANEKILKAFIDQFEFTGLRVDEALRQLLYTFRLPGESQLIERIVTVFCDKYWSDGNFDNVASTEAMFVLTYAIIMLNTDQHNPNLKGKRMALEDFARNLRGVNDQKDFDIDYLRAIYTTIKTNEIILPEEHQNKNAYDHAWKDLLVKIQDTSNLAICNTNIFDGDMFSATWKPIIATLSYVFMSASDDVVFSRVITGFDHCAQIAAKYGLTEALDHIVFCLSNISTLAAGTTPDTSLNTEVTANDKSVMVSEMAVKFGRDDRAQLATIVLFRVLEGNEATVRDGWNHIIRIMLSLFVNSLVPPRFSTIKHSVDLDPIPLQPPVQVIDREQRQNEGGLFSALSSYVSSFANDEPPEPSEQEIEYTLCSIDCIKTCKFEELLARMSELPVDSLEIIVECLLGHIPEDSSPRILVVKSELPAPMIKSHSNMYDPSLVFILELATILAMRDTQTVEAVGKEVAGALQSIIRNAANYHYVVISRAAYYLLALLRIGHDINNDDTLIRVPVILHAFSSFDGNVLQRSAVALLQGILDCMNGSSTSLRNEMATSPDFWAILHHLHNSPDASAIVFRILEDLAGPPHTGITVDNYEPAIALLNAFASLGSIGINDEQRRDIAVRRGKGAKLPKPKHREEVLRGTKSVAIVFQLTTRVPSFITASHLETTEAWKTYWSPIFRVLTRQCLNPCREIRHQALSLLLRALLSNDLASTEHKEWTKIFSEVLFPLITQLLKPEVYQSDPVGMGETRVQAATGLCKIFLHYLVALAGWEGMVELWVRILNIMERLMSSGVGDNLEEAVPESLKNILLVMADSGFLAPPEQKPEQRQLWEQTWKHLDRFLPQLKPELFPESVGKGKVQPPKSPRPKQQEIQNGGEAAKGEADGEGK